MAASDPDDLDRRFLDLRGAAALAHSVPDAVLVLEHLRGRSTVVSFGRDSQLTPCQLRELLGSDLALDLVRRVRTATLAGSFDPLGGNVFARADADGSEAWFVTPLDTDVVISLMGGRDVPVPPEALDVRLLGDTRLDVTVGRVRADADHEHSVVDVARTAHDVCAVEELVSATGGRSQ